MLLLLLVFALNFGTKPEVNLIKTKKKDESQRKIEASANPRAICCWWWWR
jgi:hypothetical protein